MARALTVAVVLAAVGVGGWLLLAGRSDSRDDKPVASPGENAAPPDGTRTTLAARGTTAKNAKVTVGDASEVPLDGVLGPTVAFASPACARRAATRCGCARCPTAARCSQKTSSPAPMRSCWLS